jgi:hypothetical protein
MNGWLKLKGDELLMMPLTATSTEMKQQIDERIGNDTRINSSVTVFEMGMKTIQKWRKNGSSLTRKQCSRI